MGVDSVSIEKTIEGKMMGLMKELARLAPHPDQPEHKGPLFVQIDSEHTPDAEYEGMLGSMILEAGIGTAFSAAADTAGGSTSQIDISNAADMASEFIRDRAPAHYQIGQKQAISLNFNHAGARSSLMEAFYRDLPRRLGLEKWLAFYQRKLYSLRKNNAGAALKFAA